MTVKVAVFSGYEPNIWPNSMKITPDIDEIEACIALAAHIKARAIDLPADEDPNEYAKSNPGLFVNLGSRERNDSTVYLQFNLKLQRIVEYTVFAVDTSKKWTIFSRDGKARVNYLKESLTKWTILNYDGIHGYCYPKEPFSRKRIVDIRSNLCYDITVDLTYNYCTIAIRR